MYTLVLCGNEEELISGVRQRFGDEVRIIHIHQISRIPFAARISHILAEISDMLTWPFGTGLMMERRSRVARILDERVFWPSLLRPIRKAIRGIGHGDVLCLGDIYKWAPSRALPLSIGRVDSLTLNVRYTLLLRLLDRYLPKFVGHASKPYSYFVVGRALPEHISIYSTDGIDKSVLRPGRFGSILCLDNFCDPQVFVRPAGVGRLDPASSRPGRIGGIYGFF